MNSFRRFDFKLYSPVLAKVFGAEVTANPGSGIEELFSLRPAGRPRQRLEIKDGDELVSIAHIIFQVNDSKTNRPYVLTTRPGKEPHVGCLSINYLQPHSTGGTNKRASVSFSNV